MIKNLVADNLEKLPLHYRESLNQNLCVCNEVPTINVIQAIVNGAKTVSEVKQKTYATDGNGCCRVQVESLIKYLGSND